MRENNPKLIDFAIATLDEQRVWFIKQVSRLNKDIERLERIKKLIIERDAT